MKKDKRNKRSAQKKKQRAITKQREGEVKAREVRQQVEALLTQGNPTEEAETQDFYGDKLLWYIGRCLHNDAFPPWVIGKLLGGLHWSKVNQLLDEQSLQLPKEVGKRRAVTDKGQPYHAGLSGSGLTWKLSLVRFLSDKYQLPLNLPSSCEINQASLALSGR